MTSPVNRRDFLAATGATLAAASIQKAVFAAGSDSKPSPSQRLHKAVKLLDGLAAAVPSSRNSSW